MPWKKKEGLAKGLSEWLLAYSLYIEVRPSSQLGGNAQEKLPGSFSVMLEISNHLQNVYLKQELPSCFILKYAF